MRWNSIGLNDLASIDKREGEGYEQKNLGMFPDYCRSDGFVSTA
jgi:hypothetical protein